MPPQIRQLVSEWRAAGSPAQDGIPWPWQRWAARFPSHASVFAMLPDRLSRLVIRGACLGAAASPIAAERSFLAVVAWGQRMGGYGPFRAQRVLGAKRDGRAG